VLGVLTLSLPLALSVAGGTHVYRGSASGPESLTTTGAPGWGTRSLEALVQPLAGSAGSMGLVLHHQDDSNHYLFLYSTNSTALMIYKKVGGAYTLLGQTPFSVPFGEEHVLGAEDDGAGNLSILWDGVPRLTVADATFGAGRVGLRVWNMTADFDDVLALDGGGATLLFDDFEDGDASGWSAGPGWTVVQESGGAVMPTPVFDTGFDGGNVEVTLVDPQSWTIQVQPELKGSSPYRAWFYFKLSNLSSAQPTNFVFQNVSFFTRPYYSYDGLAWQEFPPPAGSTYSLTLAQDPVWIAHSIPYLPAHEAQLVQDVQGPFVQTSLLATSEGGRPIDLLRITAPGDPAGRGGVWVLGRQHAWEASGSWVADGLVRWLVSADPLAVTLRRKAVVHVVPIFDEDNVVLGGSGKDQLPIDINRDWREGPHWVAVQAAIDRIDATAAAQPYALFLDSHCPGSATTFLAVQPQSMVSPSYWASFSSFRQLLTATTAGGALPYTGAYSEWGPTYHPLWYQMSFWHQFANHAGLELSLTLETQAASQAGYADLAAGLGRALERFLPCPTPVASYCTPGTSASGCQATLAACGTPSASAPTGFDLVAALVEGAKDGLFFLGTSGRQANPWGSGTSFQCVTPPVARGALLAGSGSAGSCDGGFSEDLNARWSAKPAQNPGAGATVQAQLWYRDPLSTSNQTTSLSDALEFAVAP